VNSYTAEEPVESPHRAFSVRHLGGPVALAVALLLAVAPPTHAQTLTGTISDSLGLPLREAEIIGGHLGFRTRSDSTGRFRLRLSRGGRIEVILRLVGYRQYIDTVLVPSAGTERIAVRLVRLPTRLATRVILDRSGCAATALSGFECRRDSGIGFFRDAGELRAMQPRHWADMLDGMPGLRRAPRAGPHGLDWRPAPPPSRCLREIWNGQAPMIDPEGQFQPDEMWKPSDVVAIEYYEEHRDVPPQYQRFAWWPPIGGQPCGLIVYWLRGAERTVPPQP
jgi:hypothetical protein